MPSPNMDVQEERCLMVVKSFTNLMDNHIEYPFNNISKHAVMDWFGRSVYGRVSIISFVSTHLPKCQHKIEKITRIPRVSHRLLVRHKRSKIEKPTAPQEHSEVESDGRRTPNNPICPNLKELVKAPKADKLPRSVDCSDWEFVEIKGKLQYEQTLWDGTTRLLEKEFKKIILGYSDEIHFIEYDGSSRTCRKKLFNKSEQ